MMIDHTIIVWVFLMYIMNIGLFHVLYYFGIKKSTLLFKYQSDIIINMGEGKGILEQQEVIVIMNCMVLFG